MNESNVTLQLLKLVEIPMRINSIGTHEETLETCDRFSTFTINEFWVGCLIAPNQKGNRGT